MNPRNAAGISPEELSMQDAYLEGQRAGVAQRAPGLNPFQDDSPEYAEWERGRRNAVGHALNGGGRLAA